MNMCVSSLHRVVGIDSPCLKFVATTDHKMAGREDSGGNSWGEISVNEDVGIGRCCVRPTHQLHVSFTNADVPTFSGIVKCLPGHEAFIPV
jgi:hypothetical protein